MWEKFYMQFFAANLPESFTFYINHLSCLSEEAFKCVFCVSLHFLRAVQAVATLEMKSHEKFLYFVTECRGFFSFYVIDGI